VVNEDEAVIEQPPEVFALANEKKLEYFQRRIKTTSNRREQAIALFNMARIFEQRHAVRKARNTNWRIINYYPMQKDLVSRAQNRLLSLR